MSNTMEVERAIVQPFGLVGYEFEHLQAIYVARQRVKFWSNNVILKHD